MRRFSFGLASESRRRCPYFEQRRANAPAVAVQVSGSDTPYGTEPGQARQAPPGGRRDVDLTGLRPASGTPPRFVQEQQRRPSVDHAEGLAEPLPLVRLLGEAGAEQFAVDPEHGIVGEELQEPILAERLPVCGNALAPDTGANGSPTHSLGAPTSPYTVTPYDPSSTRALQARHELHQLPVSAVRSLVDPAHSAERAKRFVQFALPDDLTYRTADHLAILPVNDRSLVERAAAAFGVDLDAILDITTTTPTRSTLPIDGPISVRTLLAHHVDLQDGVLGRDIALLGEAATCPPEQAALAALVSEHPVDTTLIQLFENHHSLAGQVGWELLLTLLPPMRLRHYSISSAPGTSPSNVELMVSLLSAPHRSGTGTHSGVASTYLHRVQPGDPVLAKVSPCRASFRIDDHARTPVIMVAAGTGLAPFRGAIADRVALRSTGTHLEPGLCYFGCDARGLDYLHSDELTAAEAQGAISMRPTFSLNPENDWTYVQHRIVAEGAEVWNLLENGATVYVCGDATRLAPAVRQAFKQIMVNRTSGSTEDAETWWKNLVADNRYVEDVFTSRSVRSTRSGFSAG